MSAPNSWSCRMIKQNPYQHDVRNTRTNYRLCSWLLSLTITHKHTRTLTEKTNTRAKCAADMKTQSPLLITCLAFCLSNGYMKKRSVYDVVQFSSNVTSNINKILTLTSSDINRLYDGHYLGTSGNEWHLCKPQWHMTIPFISCNYKIHGRGRRN